MDTKKLRQKILDLAIHGKLVPQDPNDEPASVLLERIRAEKEQLIKEGKIKKSRKTSSSSDTPHYEQVPNGWSLCRIGDVCSFENGYAFSSHDYKESGVPLIRISNIVDNQINIEQCVYIQGPVNERFIVKKGDLLIALSGATTGKMGVYNLDTKAYLNQRVGNLRIKHHEVIISEFRDYVMMAKSEEILKLAYGGAQPNISGAVICEMELLLPPLSEQIRIINELKQWLSIINSLDNGKENIRAIINQAKIKILDIAVHGKLVPQDLNDEPASELLKRINPKAEITCDNAHYGKLPDRWCLTKLGAIGRWQSGGTPSRANSEYYVGDIPWLKIADLQDGYVKECSEKISNEAICNSSAKINPEGSIALAMYGSIGKLGILTFPAATNQAICVCSSFMGVDAKYLFFFLMSQRDEFVLKAGGGVQANISKEIIINHQIAIPPLPEQLRIVSKIDNLFSLLNDIEPSLQA